MRAGAAGRQGDWQAWKEALKGIRENPLAHNFAIMRQRRILKHRRARFAPLTIGIILGGAVLVIGLAVIIYECYEAYGSTATPPATIWDYPREIIGFFVSLWDYAREIVDMFIYSLYAFVYAAYLLWLIQGIFNLVRDSLAVISKPGLKTSSFIIDDLLASSTISNHAIVVGVLRVLLPPIWRRLAIGWVLVLFIAITIMTDFWHFSNLWSGAESATWIGRILLFAPLGLACLIITSMLAATALSLYYIALGRNLNAMLLGNATGFLTIVSQGFWGTAAAGIVVGCSQSYIYGGFGDDTFSWYIASCVGALIGVALFLGIIFLMLRLAQEFKFPRALFAVSTPLAMPVLLFIATIILLAVSDIGFFDDESTAMWFGGFAACLGSLECLNPLALPSVLCLGIPIEEMIAQGATTGETMRSMLHVPMLEWYRWPVMIMLQLALIAVFARFAVRSVALRRQG